MNFALHFCCVGVKCLPHRFPARFFSLCLYNACAGCPKSQGKTHAYKLQRLFFRPRFLAGHVHGTALNYTGFPGLVQVAAESECGASLHGHRKRSQAGCPLVN